MKRAKKAGKDTEMLIGKMFGSDHVAYDLDKFESVMQERAGQN